MRALLLLLVAGTSAGLPDKGIFPEYDRDTAIAIPPSLRLRDPWLRLDTAHRVATLYDGVDAIMAWPAAGPADLAAPRAYLKADPRVVVGAPGTDEDRDGDGVVDRLDVLLGAHKLIRNGAKYHSSYHRLPYPGGDVPRTEGVCTDTVVRAFRNAGIDLQKEIHEDIVRSPRAYPMVGRADANIDHRRVKVMLPWLRRHLREVPAGERTLPGDVVLFDTFPSKPGPDHIGVVSDRERDGVLLVINNWTDGSVEGEMELLSWVPVTRRFRFAPATSQAAR